MKLILINKSNKIKEKRIIIYNNSGLPGDDSKNSKSLLKILMESNPKIENIYRVKDII